MSSKGIYAIYRQLDVGTYEIHSDLGWVGLAYVVGSEETEVKVEHCVLFPSFAPPAGGTTLSFKRIADDSHGATFNQFKQSMLELQTQRGETFTYMENVCTEHSALPW